MICDLVQQPFLLLGQFAELCHFVDGEHLLGIDENDELAIHLAHAADEVGPDVSPEAGGRLYLVAGNGQHLRYRIYYDAYVLIAMLRVIRVYSFDDDDAAAASDAGGCIAKAGIEIHH